MPIKIDPNKCQKHPECPAATSCPMGAMTQKEKGAVPTVDTTKCAGCQMCVTLCPNGAISWED